MGDIIWKHGGVNNVYFVSQYINKKIISKVYLKKY